MSFAGLLSIGVSGVNAFASGLAAVSTNIANSQTEGYKRIRTDFSDVLAASRVDQTSATSAGSGAGGVGATTRLLATEQGAIRRTDTATHLAISGDGFFVVSDRATGGGSLYFTRAGGFTADSLGNLVNDAGYYLQGSVAAVSGPAGFGGALGGLSTVNINRVPAGGDAATLGALSGVDIDKEGRLIGSYANGEQRTLFFVPVALFANADGLETSGETTFLANRSSGAARLASPGTGRAGQLENQALEISTVDIGREFSTLIETQRAYATNARIISVADEMWRTAVETAA